MGKRDIMTVGTFLIPSGLAMSVHEVSVSTAITTDIRSTDGVGDCRVAIVTSDAPLLFAGFQTRPIIDTFLPLFLCRPDTVKGSVRAVAGVADVCFCQIVRRISGS